MAELIENNNNNNISNNVNNNQKQLEQNAEKPKKFFKCDCTCSEDTKSTLKIICCPCYFFIKTFACFWDDRCEMEPYYHSYVFADNIIFFIVSLIDLIFVIIYKGKVSIGFFIVRIISDSLGMIVFWLTLVFWSEEATDEDHMEPACYSFTLIQGCLTILLNIASLILFFITDCEFKILLLILQIIHLIIPLFVPIYKNCC